MKLFFAGFLTGVGLMILYDVFRVFRMLVRHGAFLTGVENLLYWIVSAFAVSYMLYRMNSGRIRGYCMGAIVGGMVLYDRMCSRFLLKLLKKGIKWIKIKLTVSGARGKKRSGE